jgi:secondary thiamine-phosphate synthase enzyme
LTRKFYIPKIKSTGMQEEIYLTTTKDQEMIDITAQVNSIIKKLKFMQGTCHVFAAHATAAMIVNENYDPNICQDVLDSLNKIIPSGVWLHDKVDGNADAHIKAAILGPGETIPVKDNKLSLGRWQALMMVELDGPRNNRRVIITLTGE